MTYRSALLSLAVVFSLGILGCGDDDNTPDVPTGGTTTDLTDTQKDSVASALASSSLTGVDFDTIFGSGGNNRIILPFAQNSSGTINLSATNNCPGGGTQATSGTATFTTTQDGSNASVDATVNTTETLTMCAGTSSSNSVTYTFDGTATNGLSMDLSANSGSISGSFTLTTSGTVDITSSDGLNAPNCAFAASMTITVSGSTSSSISLSAEYNGSFCGNSASGSSSASFNAG